MADREDRLLAALYRTFGKAASYAPPTGAAIPCTVVFIETGNPRARGPINPVTFGGTAFRLAEGKMDILVRVLELAKPETDGVFTLLDATGQPLPGQTYVVGEAPMMNDVEQREWRCCVPFGDAQ